MVPPHDEPHRLPETPPLPGTLTRPEPSPFREAPILRRLLGENRACPGVGKIEASQRVHLRTFEGIAYIEIRK
jgi:hypothetical protein